MKVFISWSGPQSRGVAELLKRWLKRVLQATDPWISTEDIEKGSIWFNEIGTQLKDTAVGIICLTAENLNAPWILFEAGGLAKGLSQNRVCTFLIGITDRDLTPPLSQFNATKATKEDVFKLVQSINGWMGDKALDAVALADTFEVFWPMFEKECKQSLDSAVAGPKIKKRPTDEVLDELLQISRDVQRQLQVQATDGLAHLVEGRFGPRTVRIGRGGRPVASSLNPQTFLDAVAAQETIQGDVNDSSLDVFLNPRDPPSPVVSPSKDQPPPQGQGPAT